MKFARDRPSWGDPAVVLVRFDQRRTVSAEVFAMSRAGGECQFATNERPMVPGGPVLPARPPRRQLAYGITGTIIAIASMFPNSLITMNVSNLPGPLGLDIAEVSWLSAIFVAIMATSNLTLVKARIQFGFPAVTALVLIANCAMGVTQLVWPGLVTTAATRAANGLAAASLIAFSTFYMLQAFPARHRIWGSISAIGMVQVASPLARLVPLSVLTMNSRSRRWPRRGNPWLVR